RSPPSTGLYETSTVAATVFVPGSIRNTSLLALAITHTDPAPTSRKYASPATGTVACTVPSAGSSRVTSVVSGLVAHSDPKPYRSGHHCRADLHVPGSDGSERLAGARVVAADPVVDVGDPGRPARHDDPVRAGVRLVRPRARDIPYGHGRRQVGRRRRGTRRLGGRRRRGRRCRRRRGRAGGGVGARAGAAGAEQGQGGEQGNGG